MSQAPNLFFFFFAFLSFSGCTVLVFRSKCRLSCGDILPFVFTYAKPKASAVTAAIAHDAESLFSCRHFFLRVSIEKRNQFPGFTTAGVGQHHSAHLASSTTWWRHLGFVMSLVKKNHRINCRQIHFFPKARCCVAFCIRSDAPIWHGTDSQLLATPPARFSYKEE